MQCESPAGVLPSLFVCLLDRPMQSVPCSSPSPTPPRNLSGHPCSFNLGGRNVRLVGWEKNSDACDVLVGQLQDRANYSYIYDPGNGPCMALFVGGSEEVGGRVDGWVINSREGLRDPQAPDVAHSSRHSPPHHQVPAGGLIPANKFQLVGRNQFPMKYLLCKLCAAEAKYHDEISLCVVCLICSFHLHCIAPF